MKSFTQLLAVGSVLGLAQSLGPVVNVLNGSIAGVFQQNYQQDFFLGIPYAQPPTGDLRFRNPASLNSTWSGTKNATAYYPSCVGYGEWHPGYEVSEDCLALNIIRPTGMIDNNLPVAVWIHGGGYVNGGSADERYNLSFIVANSAALGKPMMAVSINYRLSGWGFLASDELTEANSTNLGIRDQRLALHWVQENIAAFGGDPSRVTIWGESAGAGSVGIHLIAYGGRDDGLFSQAIGESGNPLLLGSFDFDKAQDVYNNITKDAGCSNATDTLECLRAAPFDTLNAAINQTERLQEYHFWPRPDGDIIVNSPYEQLLNGDFVKVPYLIGTNSDEGSAFAQEGINSDAEFEAWVNYLGADNETTAMISKLYPNVDALCVLESITEPTDSTMGTQWRRAATITGDFYFIAGRRLTSTQWATHNQTIYTYRFNTISNGFTANYRGITHFTEVAYVFNNILGVGYTTNEMEGMPSTYQRLSMLMCNMWISFINDGTPNNHGFVGVPEWPAYDIGYTNGGYGQNIVLDTNSTNLAYVESDTFRGAAIAYMNTLWQTQFQS